MKHANRIENRTDAITIDHPWLPEPLRPVTAANARQYRAAVPAIAAAISRHATRALLGLTAAAATILALRAAPSLVAAGLAPAIAWAFGWVYLAWALDAPRRRAGATDALLGAATLIGAVALMAQPAGAALVFAGHALAAPLRIAVGGTDARAWAAAWFVFHAALGALLLA